MHFPFLWSRLRKFSPPLHRGLALPKELGPALYIPSLHSFVGLSPRSFRPSAQIHYHVVVHWRGDGEIALAIFHVFQSLHVHPILDMYVFHKSFHLSCLTREVMFSTRESETIHMFIPTIHLCIACRKFSPSSTGFPSPFRKRDPLSIENQSGPALIAIWSLPELASPTSKCSKTSEMARE